MTFGGLVQERFLFKMHVCYLGVFKINNSYSKENEIFLSFLSLKRYHLTKVSIRRLDRMSSSLKLNQLASLSEGRALL